MSIVLNSPVVEPPGPGHESLAARGRALRPPRPVRGGAHVVGKEVGGRVQVEAALCKTGIAQTRNPICAFAT